MTNFGSQSQSKFWDMSRDDSISLIYPSSLNNQLISSCLSETMVVGGGGGGGVSTSQVTVTDQPSSPPPKVNNTATSHFEATVSPPFIDFLGVGAT